MKKEQKESKSEFTRMPTVYHTDQHAWSVKESVGFLAYLLKRGQKIEVLVEEGQEVEVNTPLASCGENTLLAPFKGVVKEVNPALKERSINGADWIVRIA